MKEQLHPAPLILSAILSALIGGTALGANPGKLGAVILRGEEPKNLRLATISAFHTSTDATDEAEKYLPMPGPTWKEVSRLLKKANLKEVFDNEPDQAELRVSLRLESEFGQDALLLALTVTKYTPSEIPLIKYSLPSDIWERRRIIFKKSDGNYDAGNAVSKFIVELISDRKKAVENLKKMEEAFKKAK
jgi:hypothetical protein